MVDANKNKKLSKLFAGIPFRDIERYRKLTFKDLEDILKSSQGDHDKANSVWWIMNNHITNSHDDVESFNQHFKVRYYYNQDFVTWPRRLPVLHLAAAQDSLKIIKYLIEELNFEYNIRSEKGYSPVNYALYYGASIETVKYFFSLPNLDLDFINGYKENYIQCVEASENPDALKQQYFKIIEDARQSRQKSKQNVESQTSTTSSTSTQSRDNQSPPATGATPVDHNQEESKAEQDQQQPAPKEEAKKYLKSVDSQEVLPKQRQQADEEEEEEKEQQTIKANKAIKQQESDAKQVTAQEAVSEKEGEKEKLIEKDKEVGKQNEEQKEQSNDEQSDQNEAQQPQQQPQGGSSTQNQEGAEQQEENKSDEQ